MPLTFTVDPNRGTVRATASGLITYEEVRDHLEEERYQQGLQFPELIDATQATTAFTGEQARGIVEQIRQLARQGVFGPTAVLVANDVTYGMCRMLGILLGDVADLLPFRANDRAEAEAWLTHKTPRGSRLEDPSG